MRHHAFPYSCRPEVADDPGRPVPRIFVFKPDRYAIRLAIYSIPSDLIRGSPTFQPLGGIPNGLGDYFLTNAAKVIISEPCLLLILSMAWSILSSLSFFPWSSV